MKRIKGPDEEIIIVFFFVAAITFAIVGGVLATAYAGCVLSPEQLNNALAKDELFVKPNNEYCGTVFETVSTWLAPIPWWAYLLFLFVMMEAVYWTVTSEVEQWYDERLSWYDNLDTLLLSKMYSLALAVDLIGGVLLMIMVGFLLVGSIPVLFDKIKAILGALLILFGSIGGLVAFLWLNSLKFTRKNKKKKEPQKKR